MHRGASRIDARVTVTTYEPTGKNDLAHQIPSVADRRQALEYGPENILIPTNRLRVIQPADQFD